MKKRILSMVLLASMLTSLAACGGDGDDTVDTSGDTEKEETNPAGIEAANYELPFNIYAPDWGMYQSYFFADDPGTDAMTKAIYEREVAVEEHLGVDIGYTIQGTVIDVRPKVQELVMTGDDTYQLFLTHCIHTTSAMITEDLLYDFNDFEYVDMTNEWWNQQANEALAVAGHNYFAVSDYMLSDPNCILFNKSILDEFNLEDPYQLVRDGEWTIDKMMEMMAAVTTDNGDGEWDHRDTYGFATSDNWPLNSFIFSSEAKLVTRDSDGKFEFAFDDERVYTMVDKLDQLLNNPNTYVYDAAIETTEDVHIMDSEYLDISKGHSLFNVYPIQYLRYQRDTDVDFGILPYPKLDAKQDGYYINDWSGLMCVPKTVGNAEMVGKVLELLAYYSGDTVRYAYYDIMLGEKLTRDPESKEMLDIIFDGVSFDAGVTYFGFSGGMFSLFYFPDKLLIEGSGAGGFSSFLAQNQSSAEAEINMFNLIVEDLEKAGS